MASVTQFWLLLLTLFQFSRLSTSDIHHNFESPRVKNFHLSKCDTNNYPVTVSNVKIQSAFLLPQSIHLKYSGTLTAGIDLSSPIKAVVSVEKDVLGVWIPMPCVDNVGTCTYNDLCKFGIPLNKNCPQPFTEGDVPCRCPVPKGNYTIQPTLRLPKMEAVYSGKYKGVVKVKNSKTTISCYNFNVELYDGNSDNEIYSTIM